MWGYSTTWLLSRGHDRQNGHGGKPGRRSWFMAGVLMLAFLLGWIVLALQYRGLHSAADVAAVVSAILPVVPLADGLRTLLRPVRQDAPAGDVAAAKNDLASRVKQLEPKEATWQELDSPYP